MTASHAVTRGPTTSAPGPDTPLEHVPTHWIGAPPSGLEIFLVLFVGTVAILIAGLQPVMLGALKDAGRLSMSQVGVAGGAELLTLGAASGLAAGLLKPRRVRLIGAAASIMMLITNLATLTASGEAVVAWRTLCGVAEGVMMWLPISLITRSSRPERWSAIFLTVQTAAQFAVAALAPAVILPAFGANGVVGVMAGGAALATGGALLGPAQFHNLPKAPREGLGGVGLRAAGGLVFTFLFLAFIVGVWVYLEPIGLQSGLSQGVADYATSLSLGAQILGGSAAAVIGRRLPYFGVFLSAGLISLALLALLAFGGGPAIFFLVVAAHGFLWLFIMPYQELLQIDVDPSRRTALQLMAVQVLGSSAGPYVASFFVTDKDVRGALGVAAACIVLSLLILLGVRLSLPRPSLSREAPAAAR